MGAAQRQERSCGGRAESQEDQLGLGASLLRAGPGQRASDVPLTRAASPPRRSPHTGQEQMRRLTQGAWSPPPSDHPEQPALLLQKVRFSSVTWSSGNGLRTHLQLYRPELCRTGAGGRVLPPLRQELPNRRLPAEDSGCVPRMFSCTRHAAVAQTHPTTLGSSKERMDPAPSAP